jgi:predicted transcriptional regulator
MKVLMSIKPKYADKIFDGTKLFEYRRVIWNKKVDSVVVYASDPVCKVIGAFDIKRVLILYTHDLWLRTNPLGCISKEEFLEYFNGKEYGHAIQIINAFRFTPRPLSYYGISRPPQNFMYLED